MRYSRCSDTRFWRLPIRTDAIRVSESHQGTIHLLLTDVVMPKMDGPTLYAHLLGSRTDMKALFMSGYTENAIVHHGVLRPGVHFLQKPFSAEASRPQGP